MRRQAATPVHRITTARKSVADDQAARVRGYAISMSIRIACFALALVASGALRWFFVVGAVIIPYFAVVFANGGREPTSDPPESLNRPTATELPPAPDAPVR
jgi:hypothetical protein